MNRVFISFALIAILGYGVFEAQRLLEGPRIFIETPADGSATSSALVTISGSARNIAFLTINDAPAHIDPAGRFALTLSPPAGYTVFTVAAVDRFGRRARESVRLTVLDYCPIS